MGKLIDMTGKKFGKLTVKYRDPEPHTKPYWICQCECGNELSVYGTNLRNGTTTQCKQCAYQKRTETIFGETYNYLLNHKFGHLSVLEKDNSKPSGAGRNVYWKCKCDCGKYVSVATADLLNEKKTVCNLASCQYSNSITYEDLTHKNFGDLYVIERDRIEENKHSSRMTYWKCQCKCGNISSYSRNSLIRGKYACDICSKGKSIGEKNIESILIENNILYQKQVTFPQLKGVNGGYCKFDFCIYNNENQIQRIIEFDGEFHYDINNGIWNSETVKQNDIIKNDFCKNNNIPLVRIPYWERNKITLDMIMGEQYLINMEE